MSRKSYNNSSSTTSGSYKLGEEDADDDDESSTTVGPAKKVGTSNADKTSLWSIKYRSLSPPDDYNSAVEQGWRYSKSSVSTIYQSALEELSSGANYSSCDSTDGDFLSMTSLEQDSSFGRSQQQTEHDKYAEAPRNRNRSGDYAKLSKDQSPHQSFHSVHENGIPQSNTIDDEDIFSSPKGSPQLHKKSSGKSVAFQEVMPLQDIDFVLVWDGASEAGSSHEAAEKRRIFEKNLEEEGLSLEREKMESSNYNFVKIHAPPEVLRRYSEILKLRMPMKEVEAFAESSVGKAVTTAKSWQKRLMSCFRLDTRVFPEKPTKLTAVYSRDKEYLFDVDDDFFTSGIKARVVDFILSRKRFSEDDFDDFAFGVQRLIRDGVLVAAYPMHDGEVKTPGTIRNLLFTEWASTRQCLKNQPLDEVQDYFGIKIGLYFAWLGYYTHMLIPAAIFGFICFLYGCFTLSTDILTHDICTANMSDPMCPLCDKVCSYWNLNDTCFYAKITYLFDNDATVVFAIVMSFWTAIYLEFWLRYSSEISHRWDITGYDVDDEHPRPEYLARLKNSKKKKLDVVTKVAEPSVPFWKLKLPYVMFSLSMVLLLISLAIAAVIGVILYRLAILLVLNTNNKLYSWSLVIVNSSAAVINLVFIFFFNWVYAHLAEYLTDLELHRTQTEFDDSLTLKMYLLQFVNYYSSIFYIAFFKGRFIGSPNKYTKLFGYRQEECAPGGCMTELCIQLAIIMVGKQAMNMIIEVTTPILITWWNHMRIMTGANEEKSVIFNTQWAKDLKLLDFGPRSLFPEYLEMILQYGFVTIFVAAFPLAPLFALLNNVLEMRFDAKKLITCYRRPVGQRVKDIGIWYGIMDTLGKLAVITNAFIIAFTSNFIPKMVYRADFGSLDGFLEHSLSVFRTADQAFDNSRPLNRSQHVQFCRFQAYRGSWNSERPYKRTEFYWRVWMARLAFIVVFENFVATCVILLRWIIPDEPVKIRNQIRREAYLTNEIIIKHEMYRARGGHVSKGDTTAWNPEERELNDLKNPTSSQSPNVRKRRKDDNDSESAEVMV